MISCPLDRLHALGIDRMDSRLDLAAMRTLLHGLGDPHKSLQTIHIAGTNGKGSVAAKIAASLAGSGLYTSPHLLSFRERIRVNLEPISASDAHLGLKEILHVSDALGLTPTYFEVMTALAFWHFAATKVPIAVIETGLGGRLDATNVITPLLSVITSIAHDHCDRLGHTLAEIAREKAGIVKAGVPVVVGPTATGYGIRATQTVLGPFDDVQEENRALAQAALSLLGLDYDPAGLDVAMPCRFQYMEHPLPMVVDVAHNRAGMKRLFQSVDRHFPEQPVTVIFGCSQGRDPRPMLTLFSGVARLHLIEVDHPRSMPLTQLLPLAQGLPLGAHGSLPAILEQLCAAPPRGVIVLCGSHYIMSALYEEQTRRCQPITEPAVHRPPRKVTP